MADDESSSTSDESLDVKSVKFNPMKALYSKKIQLSTTKAPIYDNVSKFEAVISGLAGKKKKKDETDDVKRGECSRQRFLPHQETSRQGTRRYMPVYTMSCTLFTRILCLCGIFGKNESYASPRWIDRSEGKRYGARFHRESHCREPVVSRKTTGRRDWSIEGRNVLAKMQRAFGPLGMLHGYMESRTRVKVYTRNARGIRGHVEAYVAAFDKHWNLALEDCFEVWTRKVKRKAPALGAPSGVNTKEDTAPKVVVKKIEGKEETLERHVPQMLLRGEQVAIIVKIN